VKIGSEIDAKKAPNFPAKIGHHNLSKRVANSLMATKRKKLILRRISKTQLIFGSLSYFQLLSAQGGQYFLYIEEKKEKGRLFQNKQ
jgi:hypothetical protein